MNAQMIHGEDSPIAGRQPTPGEIMAHNIRSALVAAAAMREAGNTVSEAQERRILMGATGVKTGKALTRAMKALRRYEVR